MGLYPEGLIDSIERTLIQCQNAAKDISPSQLLKEALDHFEKVQEASGSSSHINVLTAEAIAGVFRILVREWDGIPALAQSWCKAMMRYFTIADGIEDDFNSPIGFDDDAEVVNACLKFAGRADLCLDVETVQENPKLPSKPKIQKTTAPKSAIAPGMRVLCRDAEWLVTRVNITGHDPIAYQVHCVGADDLVREHEAIFLSQLDDITPVDPRQTRLVADISNGYQLSKLFMGARLRQMPAIGIEPDFNGMGVFRPMAFQKETVRRALHQLRPRLLLADAVGLGKTIQVGMILTEILRRGRANRILVLAKKSMLTQFQAELWNRFSIPLVRLDSTGIARLRLRIPANKNPFEVYHRVIISLDTLKNVGRYEHFLKDTHWDVVIINEAHNVAGASIPERNLSYRLARQLARRTNSILLTTATPHNGKRETFGRLISLLDPSVIPDPAFREYGRDDIKHFILMRFKEDARADAGEMLTERQVIPISQTTVNASPEEEEIYRILGELRQASTTAVESSVQGGRQHALVEALCPSLPSPVAPVLNARCWHQHPMVQYVLYKLFLSSPDACVVTVRKRIQYLLANEPDSPEMPYLQRLENHLDKLDITGSSRYRLRQSGESVLQLYDPEAEEAYIANQGILANDPSVLDHQAPEASPESATLEAKLREASLAGNDEYLDFLLGVADTPAPESKSQCSPSHREGAGGRECGFHRSISPLPASPRWGEEVDLPPAVAESLLYLKHLLGEREKQLPPLLINEERRLRNWRNRRQAFSFF